MEKEFVPFAERPQWSDITPIEQDDGPEPVVSIAYTKEFKEVMGYFRAILKLDEKSERTLELTREVIDMNPGNYTAWYFRRKILEALGSDIRKEMEIISEIAESTAKNYQIWYHRRLLAEKLNDGPLEIDFTRHILLDVDEDAKNYHAWAHRQWALKHFNLFDYKDGELSFVEELLKIDLRNNSAWNQRFFTISNTTDVRAFETRKNEIEYAFSYIRKAPNNESPWNYLRAFVLYESIDKNDELLLKTIEQCVEISEKYPTCPHVLALLLDAHEANQQYDKAVQSAEKLKGGVDIFRSKYWEYRIDQIEKQKASVQ